MISTYKHGSVGVQVSGKVYSLVVNRAQLVPHLNAIKDYLLIGRCDFFSIFLEASADAMHRAPHPSTATPNLERAFHSAAARTGVDATAEFDCVGISWQAEVPAVAIDGSTAALVPAFFHAAPAGGDGREAPSWNGVVLTYTPPWPLPLLLTRDAMEVYEMLFRYLLAVERAVRALDEVQPPRHGRDPYLIPSGVTVGLYLCLVLADARVNTAWTESFRCSQNLVHAAPETLHKQAIAGVSYRDEANGARYR